MKRRFITVFSLGVALIAFSQLPQTLSLSDYTDVNAVTYAKAAQAKQHIFGQVQYDQANTLPSQANLLIQLIDQSTQGAPHIISELVIPADNSGKTTFELPIQLNQLDGAHQYSLKARISIGDSLIYVTEKPTIIDMKQSGYIMKLSAVGQHSQNRTTQKKLTGAQWIAREINKIATIQDAEISLTINNSMLPQNLGLDNNISKNASYSVNGTAGCNRFFSAAAIDQDAGTLTFDNLGMTFISCPKTISDQESRFVNMMSQVRSFEIDTNNILNLKDSFNHIIARFIASNAI